METLCKIILVDDHSLFRNGLRGLLAAHEGYEVVGEAASGEEFLAMLPTRAADVVFMQSRVSAVPAALHLSRETMKIAMENVVFALGIKAVVMIAGFAGYASMWAAVFADSGVAALCVLNSVRMLYKK